MCSTPKNLSSNSLESQECSGSLFFDRCPHCFGYFDFLRRTGKSKVPLIIKCGHTLCEDCIRLLGTPSGLTCPQCNEISGVPQGKKLDEVFMPHYALIGQLVWFRNVQSTGGKINWSSSKEKPTFLEQNTANLRPSARYTIPKCDEHPDSYTNILCQKCREFLCSLCYCDGHTGHAIKQMYKLTADEVSELRIYQKKAQYILTQLRDSEKKIQQLKNVDCKEVEKQIRLQFGEFHAKLHLVEKSLLEKLSKLQVVKTNRNVIEVHETITSAIDHVQQILCVYEHIDKNMQSLNFHALYKEMKALDKLPCSFEYHQSLAPISFSTSLTLDDIESQFSISQSTETFIDLQPVQDWDNVPLDQIEDEGVCEDGSVVSEGSQHSITSKISLDVKQNKNKINSDLLLPGKLYFILVTHINSWDSFFVQKKSDLCAINQLNNELTKTYKHNLKTIFTGKIYNIRYKERDFTQWRRGLIEKSYEEEENVFYNVFYIDYGNRQTVTRDRIKQLDLQTCKRQPFAIECKLTNPEGKLFENSLQRITQMLAKYEVYMKYVDKIGERSYEIELFVKMPNSEIVSIKHLLSSNEDMTELPVMNVSTQVKLFKNSTTFTVGQVETVILSHIINPFEIYIQLHKNAASLEKMSTNLNNYYEHIVKNAKQQCVVTENKDFVVHYAHEKHGNWHRATVLSVDKEERLANVFFVDWGGNAIIPLNDIHYLTDEFIKMECQAIKVSMADIEPKCDEWSETAISLIQNQSSTENSFLIEVYNVEPLQVVVFENTPTADICLNAMLVDNSFAISTGQGSELVFWQISDRQAKDAQIVEEYEIDFATEMLKKAESVLCNQIDLNANEAPGVRSQVDIVRFENPNKLFIKFAKSRENEQNMYRHLKIFYNGKQGKQKKLWKKGEFCIVHDAKKKQYFRAIITERINQNKYIVYLYDMARTLTTHNDQLYLRDEYFDNFGQLTYKCYLNNIKPTGGTGTWSQLSNELIDRIFASYKSIYICVHESYDKWLGVEMFYTYTTIGNAFDMPKPVLLSINKILIESGLALSTAKEDQQVNLGKMLAPPRIEPEIQMNNQTETEAVNDEKESVVPTKTTATSWMDRMKIKDVEFEAMVITVDTGIISIRDSYLQKCYQDVEVQLSKAFVNAPCPRKKTKWVQGEICSVRYDKKWYRGVVLEYYSPEHIFVEMIDFGSEHIMTAKDLSKYIMFADVPPLIYKIRMFDVQPASNCKWTGDADDTLLGFVGGNNKIRVQIVDDKGEYPLAEIYLRKSNSNLNDLLVSCCEGLVRTEKLALETIKIDTEEEESQSEENVESEEKEKRDENEKEDESEDVEEEEEVLTSYCRDFLTNTEDVCSLYIINIIGKSIVLSKKNSTGFVEAKELSLSKEFYDEMQLKSSRLDEIKVIAIGTPCMAFCPNKKVWFRSLICDTNCAQVQYVVVFYVDYGITNVCRLENLRVIPSAWLKHPIEHVIADLNVELVTTIEPTLLLMQIYPFMSKLVQVRATCVDPLIVELRDKGKLLYEALIDSGDLKVPDIKNKSF